MPRASRPLALPLPSPRPCGSALAARPGGRLRSCGATRRTARGAACVSESVRSRAGRGVARRSPASDRVRPACARGDRGRRGLAAAVRPERSAQGPTAERAPCLVAGIVGYPARFGSVSPGQHAIASRDAPSRHSTHNRVTPETRHDARPRSDYNDLRTTEHSSARSDLDLPRARITWNEHHDA